MEIPIEQIRVAGRVRKDLGDLDGLVQSLRASGQMNPVTVTRDYVLIAGQRRLEAARKLGWQTIEARVVDGRSAPEHLEMEIAENLYRRDFSAEEVLEALRRLEKMRRPAPAQRFFRALKAWVGRLCFWRRAPVSDPKGAETPPFPAAHA